MTDYSAVAPPQNLAGGFDPSSAFADALQRARQIAAKINTPGSEGNAVGGGGTKRPHEDSNDMEWGEQNATKKMASLNDPIGAQLAAIQQQQRLGVQSNSVVTIEYHVPDKMVGLIIGRGGEQITRLQAESGCKIQMAADSGGLPERSCSLTGSKQAIEKAQEMISEIVNRGTTGGAVDPGGPMVDSGSVVELMIPASKVGLIIGKGGETIKNLQERAGVKMVMIQDGMFSNTNDKPLRIKGDPQKAEYARQLVMDLLTERELEQNMSRGGGGGGGRGDGGGFNRNQSHTNDYGSGQNGTQEVEVAVPRQAVGVVIGKGGEMIKKIQQDSGARVQFQQDDGPGDRMCFLTGSSEQIQQAQGIIHELIGSVLARDQQNMGRGRGRGRGGGGGFDDRRGGGGGGRGGLGGNDYMGNQGGMGRGPPRGGGGPPDWVEASFTVPANKCGIVIGKGGETIRAINQQAGAHVELSRNPPPNPAEKLFIIRGLPSQIEHAKQLITEKIGGGINEVSNSGGAPSSGPYGMSGGPSQPQGGSGYGQNSQQQPQGPQGYTPQGWGSAYQHWQAQPTAPGAGGAAGDPNKQAVDANAAAWAAYYAQYAPYNQAGQAVAAQPTAPGQQPPSGQQPAAPAAQAGGGAQPDYSAAWAEYYRTMGMFREAEMIEQQARAGQQPTGQQQGAPAQVAAQSPVAANPQAQQSSAAPAAQPNQSPAQPGQPPYSQYGQYPQYGQQGPFPYNFSAAYAQPQ